MNTIIDITISMGTHTPVWPDSEAIQLARVHRIEDGYQSNVTRLSCDVHTGTHIDAPLHFISGGNTVSQIPLDILVGKALVCSIFTDSHITNVDLVKADIKANTERLLLKTRNSSFWKEYGNIFQPNYSALTPEAAQWIVDKKIKLIGIDYLSIQPYEDITQATHKILLSAGIIILEGINLSDVQPGEYELICLPLKLENTEGAPARAILRK